MVLQSHFVSTITSEDITTRKTGKSVYRTLIPTSRLLANPLTAALFSNEPSGFLNAMNSETGIFFMAYPCRSGKEMNFAVFHPTKPHQRDATDWNSPASVSDVLDVLEGFHPALREVAKCADEGSVKCYVAGYRDVIPKMNKGKAVLIGDAAHPFSPTHAQGAGMGIEDAAALEVLFSDWCPTDSVERRLELFNKLRLPRDNVTQLLSDAMFYNKQEAPEYVTKKVREFYSGPMLPPGQLGWSEGVREFWYGYDAFAEAAKAMDWKEDPGCMPEGLIKHFSSKCE